MDIRETRRAVSGESADDAPVALPAELQHQLARFLEHRLRALEDEERERADRARRAAVQRTLVEMGTWLALIAAYSVLVALVSSATLIAALVDPSAIGHRLSDMNHGYTTYSETIPDDVRKLIYSALIGSSLLVLRVASLKSRSAAGGVIFIGVAVLSLVGFSAAFASGPVGVLAALPGFAGVLILIRRFLVFINGLPGVESVRAKPTTSRPPRIPAARRFDQVIKRLGEVLSPVRDRPLGVAFVAVPIVAIVVVLVAAAVNSYRGPLFWASRISQIVFLAWCLWAVAVTPRAVRIPLWSAPVTGTLTLLLFLYGTVAVVFLVVLLAVLLINVFMAVPLIRYKGTG
jgi:hypothetical protein